ncbi:MAG TPA: hypothetical protein VKQ72_22635 [Aggregatilineales bacterium]|nr:hypothetical protein [Aggregatilineales bacterium]
MAATFETIQEDIVLNRYSEPLTANDIQYMTIKDDEYSVSHSGPIHVVADFSEIKAFPSGLLTLGLRPGMNNPMRNPKVSSIVVICNSQFINQLASVVSRVARIDKLVVVKNWDEARAELGKASESYKAHGAQEDAQLHTN